MKVKVGYTPVAAYLPMFVGIEHGYYQQLGLDLELVQINLATDLVPAFGSGQVDMGGYGIDVSLFNAVARGVDMRILAYFGAASPTSSGLSVIVRKDLVDSGKYKEPKDFKGMTVGVLSANSSPAYYLERALGKGGLTLNDVTLVTMQFPDMLAALANKKIDAAVEVQPFVLQADTQGIAKIALRAGEFAPGFPSIVLVANPPFLKAQPEAAKRFVLALLQGQRDAYNALEKGINKGDVFQVMAKYTTLKDPKMQEAVANAGGYGNTAPNGQIPLDPLNQFQDFFVRQGTQPQKIDISKIVDTSYMDYALSILGK